MDTLQRSINTARLGGLRQVLFRWMRALPRLAAILLIGAGSVLAAPVPARAEPAATFTVDSTADAVDANPGNGTCATAGGACTLRAAIQEANALTGADTIILPAGTYNFAINNSGGDEDAAATGDLDITAPLTLAGAGAATTIIDGQDRDRVFEISAGVTISGVTVRNGSVSDNYGGGIYIGSNSDLTLIDSIVSGNTARYAGGICVCAASASLTLTGSTISSNSTGYSGDTYAGGIYNVGALSVTNSTISTNSIWADNSCTPGFPLPTCTSYTSYGGGIYNAGTATLLNTTISSNSASRDNCTFICLPGPGSGGGIYDAATISLKNTIVAYSSFGSFFLGGAMANCSGTITSNGRNIDTADTCGFGSNDLRNTDPLLGPLQNNGGQTLTRALQPGSPAINAGDNNGCPSTDQRGEGRLGGCDIGAFEYVARIYLPVARKDFGPCEVEANNDFTQANGPLLSGASYCGTYNGGSTDQDWFKFTKASGGTVTVTLSNGAQLAVYAQNGGTKIGEAVGSSVVITCSGTNQCTPGGGGNTDAAGTYYIRVITAPGQSGNYSLVVTFP